MVLPIETATDAPRENGGGFCAQFRGERLVHLEALRERDQTQPSPKAVRIVPHDGFVVRAEPVLPERLELEELAVEEPRGDGIASGQRLDARLVQPCAIVRLAGDHEAPADERSQVVGDRRPVFQLDRGERHVPRVIPEHPLDGVRQGALAVGAGPVEQEQHLLARDAGEAVADGAPDELDERLIATEDFLNKLLPARAVRVGLVQRPGLHRDAVF